jgi:hypothetical protein
MLRCSSFHQLKASLSSQEGEESSIAQREKGLFRLLENVDLKSQKDENDKKNDFGNQVILAKRMSRSNLARDSLWMQIERSIESSNAGEAPLSEFRGSSLLIPKMQNPMPPDAR